MTPRVVDMALACKVEPHPDVVRILEAALEKARAGEIQGVAISCVKSGKRASWHLVGHVESAGLLGGLVLMKDAVSEALRRKS